MAQQGRMAVDDVLATITAGCRKTAERMAAAKYTGQINALKAQIRRIEKELKKEKAKRDPTGSKLKRIEAREQAVAQDRENIKEAATLLATYADALDSLEKMTLKDLVTRFKKPLLGGWGRITYRRGRRLHTHTNHAQALRSVRSMVKKTKVKKGKK